MSKTTLFLSRLCQFAAYVLLVASISIIISSLLHQKEISKYLKDGEEKEVNIIECINDNDILFFGNEYKVKISFFTKPILKGGEFKLYTISKFVNKKLFKELKITNKAKIVYLDIENGNSIIFKQSLDKKYFSFTKKIDVGIVFLLTGLVLIVICRNIKGEKNKSRNF